MRTLTLAFAAALAITAPAAAEGVVQMGNAGFNVRLIDLDLTTAAGRARALERVETAATRICHGVGSPKDDRACRAQIIASAIAVPGGEPIRTAISERAAKGAVQTASNQAGAL